MMKLRCVLTAISLSLASVSVNVFSQGYYESVINPFEPSYEMRNAGWEYYGEVRTYTNRYGKFTMAIPYTVYYKNIGNSAVLKVSDGLSVYSVRPNNDGSPFDWYFVAGGIKYYFNL